MQNNETQYNQTRSIRFEPDLVKKVNELREGTERNFSQQVKYMLRKYIELVSEK